MSIPVENDKDYDFKNSEYFNSLPAFIQESVIQSAGLIKNEDDLKSVAGKIM